jgi:predicted ATPase/class 3 adenylate cyclase
MSSIPSGTITFLFTDIERSTRMWEEHSLEMKSSLEKHDKLMRQTIESFSGYVFKTVGDAFCASFSNAGDAVSAAIECQKKLQSTDWGITPIKVRMGIHTGSADERNGDYFGQTLNRTARLMSVGHGCQILISKVTQELILDKLAVEIELKNLGSRRLKDLDRSENIFQVNIKNLEKKFPPLRTLEIAVNNLPLQLTNFIGRGDEIEDIVKLLSNSRLLTLLGPGGVGKTRLSIHIATEYLDTIKDGIWFIDLSSITDSEFIFNKIAEALNIGAESSIPIEQNVINYLKKKTVLLILDNCEHLISSCSKAANNILIGCPEAKILATSREPLKILGETTFRVSSLGIPPSEVKEPEQLDQYESARLFIDRSLKINPSFSVTNQSAPALVQICIWLDGMPLALELAAARTRIFSLKEIAERLTNRFKLLKSNDQILMPRQKTLRSLIDWSYDLLSTEEQLLFAKLSIFSGGWDYDAAETICNDNIIIPLGEISLFYNFINGNLSGVQRSNACIPDEEEKDILEVLTALVEKSLVIVDEVDGKSRYRMLVSINEYAREKLLETGMEGSLNKRYLEYYILKAERIELRVFKDIDEVAPRDLSPDYTNIQKALSIGLEQVDLLEKGMRLAGALYPFWKLGGYYLEGLDWCRRFLTVSGESTDLKIRWKVLFEVLMFSENIHDLKEIEKFIDEILDICKKLNSQGAYALALRSVGFISPSTNIDRAMAAFKKSLSIFEKTDLNYWIPITIMNLGVWDEDIQKGAALLEESLIIARRLQHRTSIVGNLFNLGSFDIYTGNYKKAVNRLEEGLVINKYSGDRFFRLLLLSYLGTALRCLGNMSRAEECYNEVLNLSEELGIVRYQQYMFGFLGLIKLLQGESEETKRLLLKSFKLHVPRNPMNTDLVFLFVSAKIFYSMEYYILSVIILSFLKPLMVKWDDEFSKMDLEDYSFLIVDAKIRISLEEYNEAWEEGSKLSFDQLIELALESDFFKEFEITQF